MVQGLLPEGACSRAAGREKWWAGHVPRGLLKNAGSFCCTLPSCSLVWIFPPERWWVLARFSPLCVVPGIRRSLELLGGGAFNSHWRFGANKL